MAGVLLAPAVRQPSGANDLVGFNFNAGARGPLAAQQGGFGQAFAPGLVSPAQAIEVERGGITYPAQLVPLATYIAGEPAEPAHVGSVKHALVVTAFPALAARATQQAMLRRASTPPAGPNVAIMAADLAPFTGSLTVSRRYGRDDATGVPFAASADLSASALFASGAPAARFAGPLATEVRCIRDIPGTSIRVVLDIRKHATGTVSLSYQFRADKYLWVNPNGDTQWDTAAMLLQGGTGVYNESFRINTGQLCRKVLNSALAASVNAQKDPHEHNVQLDAPYLSWIGALPPFDYRMGVAESVLAKFEAQASSSWFRRPFSASEVINEPGNLSENMIQKSIGGVGGRSEIASIPGRQTAWFSTGDERARRWLIAQGETAGSISHNLFDVTKNVALNNFPGIGYPSIFHNQVQTNNITSNMTMIGYAGGWATDYAHMPSLAFAPYLVTGDRFFGDLHEYVANAHVFSMFERNLVRRDTYERGGPDWNLHSDPQPRTRGWVTRTVAQASGWLPDTSPFRQRFRDMLTHTAAYLANERPRWDAAQGQLRGQNPDKGWAASDLKPFMQDHVIAGLCEMVRINIPGAIDHLAWSVAGRTNLGLQDPAVLPPYFIRIYATYVGAPPFITTYAGLKAHLPNAGWNSDPGNYTALAMRSLQEGATYLDDPKCRRMLGIIAAASPAPGGSTATDFRTSHELWAEHRRELPRV